MDKKKDNEEIAETEDSQKFFSNTQRGLQKIGGFFIEFLKTAIIIGVLAFIIRYFLVQPFIVEGASMQPNFEDNEYILIEKVSNYFSDVERGKVVVFRYPENPNINYIKRIIGTPGDKIEIKDGKIRVWTKEADNSFILNEEYLGTTNITSGEVETTLGDNEYFVLGDNRNNSSDSRDWGLLPRENIIGNAWLIVFPTGKFGFVPLPEYNFK